MHGALFAVLLALSAVSSAQAPHQQWNAHANGENKVAAASAAPVAPEPPSDKAHGKGCHGTSKPHLSCDAIGAQAALDQASSAEEQATLSVFQAVAGTATVVLALFAALQAARANELTHTVAAAQMRPWIIYVDTSLAPSVTPEGKTAISIVMQIKNIGQLPARDTMFAMEAYTEARQHKPVFKDVVPPLREVPKDLPPGVPILTQNFIKGAEMDRFRNREVLVFAYLKATYTDPSTPKETKQTEACVAVEFTGAAQQEGKEISFWDSDPGRLPKPHDLRARRGGRAPLSPRAGLSGRILPLALLGARG